MLALFAIQRNAYIIQQVIDQASAIKSPNKLITAITERNDRALDNAVQRLAVVMDELGECVNDMQCMNALDGKLMEIPYDIIYGRKTPEDYRNDHENQRDNPRSARLSEMASRGQHSDARSERGRPSYRRRDPRAAQLPAAEEQSEFE